MQVSPTLESHILHETSDYTSLSLLLLIKVHQKPTESSRIRNPTHFIQLEKRKTEFTIWKLE